MLADSAGAFMGRSGWRDAAARMGVSSAMLVDMNGDSHYSRAEGAAALQRARAGRRGRALAVSLQPGRIEELITVLAGCLGAVHREVGASQQDFGFFRVARTKAQPHAHRDAQPAAAQLVVAAAACKKLLRHFCRELGIEDLLEDGDKLVPAH